MKDSLENVINDQEENGVTKRGDREKFDENAIREKIICKLKEGNHSEERFRFRFQNDNLIEWLSTQLQNKEVLSIDKYLRCITDPEMKVTLMKATKDNLGNTFIHLAAKNNRAKLLDHLLRDSGPNEQNSMGETSLHLAAEGGCLEAIKMLLDNDEIKIDIQDIQGNTALHSAMRARLPKQEIVILLINAYARISNHPRSSSNDEDSDDDSYFTKDFPCDKSARTPLHVAAIHMSTNRNDCIDVIRSLRVFDPDVTDNNEETALHIAVRIGNFGVLEAMLEVFYGLEKDVNKHMKNKDGHSLLDVCAMKGDCEMVTLLIDYGADPRDGVLYHIVSESVRKPRKADDLVKVYRTIIDQAEKWSRIRSNEGKTVKNVVRKIGIISTAFILGNKCNFENHVSEDIVRLLNDKNIHFGSLSVIDHAVDEGAVSMFEAILRTEQLYKKTSDANRYLFKVENCVSKRNYLKCISNNEYIERSVVDRIVGHSDDIGSVMLNIEPMSKLIKDDLVFAYILYGLLTLAQLIYMTCFTIFHIPNICRYNIGQGLTFNSCNNSVLAYEYDFSDKSSDQTFTVAYIIWPLLLLAFEIFCNIGKSLHEKTWLHWFDFWSNSFPIIVVIWICVFQNSNNTYEQYVACTAIVFISGWLRVFYFISFFERFNKFSSLLREIVVKDVLNFAILIALLLIGFSCAIVSLYQTRIPGPLSSRSLTVTAYRAFFEILSPGSTFLEETTDSEYGGLGGGGLDMFRVVVVVYEILTFVILFNILIAMMSDTYNKKISNAERTAQLSLIRVASNLKGWWPRAQRQEVYLPAHVVDKCFGRKTVRERKKHKPSNRLTGWLRTIFKRQYGN